MLRTVSRSCRQEAETSYDRFFAVRGDYQRLSLGRWWSEQPTLKAVCS